VPLAGPAGGGAPPAGPNTSGNIPTDTSGASPGQQVGAGLNAIGDAYGVYNGLRRGGAAGYAGAALSGVGLVNNAARATTGSPLYDTSGGVGQGIGEAGNVLGIYNGIRQGGVAGYGGAAVNAAQLGSATGAFGGASSAVAGAAGYVAAPLALYNEIKNWQSGATGSDALAGAETGAAIGSVVPGVGTIVGGVIGGVVGAVSSLFGSGKPGEASGYWNHFTSSQILQKGANGRDIPQQAWAEAFKGMLDEGNNIFAGGGSDRHKNPDALAMPLENQIKAGMAKLGPNATTDQVYNQFVVPWMQTSGSGLNWAALKNEPQQLLMIRSAVDRVLGGQPITRAEMKGPV
jgi:hypothetical protein